MNFKSFTLSVVAVALISVPCSADPADSLFNVVTWSESDGGNGHTYAILKMTITWDSSRVIAPTLTMDSMPGYLATATSQEENDFILDNVIIGAGVQPVIAQQFFLGGQEQNSIWGWLSGEPFNFTNWAPGEPNNVGIETVLSMWGFEESGQPAGKWNNTLPNLEVNPYIRQWSIVEWGEPDTTQGSIDTLVKIVKWEFKDGGNEHTYAILKQRITWDSANALVPTLVRFGEPGYLASITSLGENDFIQYQLLEGMPLQSSLVNQYFTGGVYENNKWGWLTGEPFIYTNWAPTEPNNIGIEIVTSIWGYGETDPRRPAGKWNNTLPNLNINPYIQQWSVVEWDEPDTTKTVMSPELIYTAMAHSIEPFYVTIYLGNLEGSRSVSNVNLSSLSINGSFAPSSTLIVPSHPRFKSDVVEMQVDVALLLAGYGLLWNTSEQVFTVEGTFDDDTTFSNDALFTVRGHISGDVNLDGSTNIRDLIYLVDYIFRSGPEPKVSETSDVDGSCGKANIGDLTYFVDYVFRGGASPLPGCTEQ